MGRALGVGVGRGVTVGVTVGVTLGVGVIVAVGVGVGVGVGSPPFVVRRIVPESPTAMPVEPSLTNETSFKLADVPLVSSVHVIPMSVLCKIRPPQPTANPLVGCGRSRP